MVEEDDPKVVAAVCRGLSKAVEEDQVAEGLVGNTVGVEDQVGGGGLVVGVEDGIPDGEVEVEERIPEAAVEVVDLVDAHGEEEEEGEVVVQMGRVVVVLADPYGMPFSFEILVASEDNFFFLVKSSEDN
ncbi:hypothetical protein ACFX2A_048190 [Malus domestica]